MTTTDNIDKWGYYSNGDTFGDTHTITISSGSSASGYVCSYCGEYVPSGWMHDCHTAYKDAKYIRIKLDYPPDKAGEGSEPMSEQYTRALFDIYIVDRRTGDVEYTAKGVVGKNEEQMKLKAAQHIPPTEEVENYFIAVNQISGFFSLKDDKEKPQKVIVVEE